MIKRLIFSFAGVIGPHRDFSHIVVAQSSVPMHRKVVPRRHLAALHFVHDALRCVPLEAIKEIADILDLSPAEVNDTMSFYQFFRDEKAFEVLEHRVLPDLLQREPKNAPLRLWVAGCATGGVAR